MMEWFVDVLPIAISVLALVSSFVIGRKQVEISKLQTDAQNKVELYLLCESMSKVNPSNNIGYQAPVVTIRNISGNVVYLEKYVFNGSEHSLGKYVLPPVSDFPAFRYIDLPMNTTDHVSLVISFRDWQDNLWETTGYADVKNGIWELTYSPAKKCK